MSLNGEAASFVPTGSSSSRGKGRGRGRAPSSQGRRGAERRGDGRERHRPSRGRGGRGGATSSMSREEEDLQLALELSMAEASGLGGGSGGGGKRGVSANHLLNFTFQDPRARQGGPPARRAPRRVASTPFDRQRFIHATFRFLLPPAPAPPRQLLLDADAGAEWSEVEEILLASPHLPHCPICLTPPRAARITKCGHIFCLPCVLHYLSYSPKGTLPTCCPSRPA